VRGACLAQAPRRVRRIDADGSIIVVAMDDPNERFGKLMERLVALLGG
jgi:hypothetical protein